MKITVCAGLALALSAVVSRADFLGPTAYLSFTDSPFASTAFDSFYLEDFEDGAPNTLGLTASGGGPSVPGGGFTDSVDGDSGPIDGSGNSGRSWYSTATLSQFTFSFSSAALGTFPTHAGVVWTDVGNVTSGTLGFGDVTFEAFDPFGVSLGVLNALSLGDGSATGGTAEDRFFGVINAAGISSIRISMTNSVDWEVDHVQYGIVPAPASIGLLGLACVASRRSRPR